MDNVIKQLKEDLLKLEKEGIEVTANNQSYKIRGTICFLVSDNLAANALAGLVESFNENGNKILINF